MANNRFTLRRFSFPVINSNMYILCHNSDALLVDAIPSPDSIIYLQEHGIKAITLLLTHEHYDHTFGFVELCRHFSVEVICQRSCASAVSQARNNRPIVFSALTLADPSRKSLLNTLPRNYQISVSRSFVQQETFRWHDHQVKMVATPGHSAGSCCIELNEYYVFTGDSWIFDTPVITRFPTSDSKQFESVTTPYLRKIPNGRTIMPGHGPCFQKHADPYI